MYTRTIQNDESGGAQSFRRGGHNIPASYSGNVFFTDFEPESEPESAPMPEETPAPVPPESPPAKPPRALALDDLLLLALILLISYNKEENSTETLILLGILFLTGF
ncbi:MAG: hypothetical protein E7632_13180 [Ruminococcaceae bacterium]|nr:hypothetical protein [Oscillospiraceae bacterium]